MKNIWQQGIKIGLIGGVSSAILLALIGMVEAFSQRDIYQQCHFNGPHAVAPGGQCSWAIGGKTNDSNWVTLDYSQ